MSLQTGDRIVYNDLKTKIVADIFNFCSKHCVNIGENMTQEDILNNVSSDPNVKKCFDPRLCTTTNCIYGPVDNGGSKTVKLSNPNYTTYRNPWPKKTASVTTPHIIAGSDVGYRKLYYVIASDEYELLSKTYSMKNVQDSLDNFLNKFQIDLKDKIITTKDMIHFFCCMLTFVENKVLKVSGGSIFSGFKVPAKMAYYFHDCQNDGITIRSIDIISETDFNNLDNLMSLLNSKINTHHIKYNFIESKK